MYLPDDANGARRWNATRYMLAAMHLLYYALHDTTHVHGKDHTGIEDCEWDAIIDRQLLSQQEAVVIGNYKGMKPFLVIGWALHEVQAQLDFDPFTTGHASDMASVFRQEQVVTLFRDHAFRFRTHCSMILNLLKLQVPFPYFHLLNMIMTINCLLVAYATVEIATWPLSVIIVFSFTSCLLGMRALAISLSDPFGGDEVDFNLEAFLKAAYTDSIAQLQTLPLRPHMDSLVNSYDKEPMVNPAINPEFVLEQWHTPFHRNVSRFRREQDHPERRKFSLSRTDTSKLRTQAAAYPSRNDSRTVPGGGSGESSAYFAVPGSPPASPPLVGGMAGIRCRKIPSGGSPSRWRPARAFTAAQRLAVHNKKRNSGLAHGDA